MNYPNDHTPKYVEEAGLIDEYHCSCGWKSGPYYDGAEFAYNAWKKHARQSSTGGETER